MASARAKLGTGYRSSWRSPSTPARRGRLSRRGWNCGSGREKDITPIASTEAYERQLWEELNTLLAGRMPADATLAEAEDAMLVAVMGVDPDAFELYERARMLARSDGGGGYLRERWVEDGPVQRVRQRIERAARAYFASGDTSA